MQVVISLENLGKKFNREWIFRGLTYQFVSGESYVITGANGSGKSTLLQVLSGVLPASEGKLTYHIDKVPIDLDKAHQYLSMATPYMELIEEFTLLEHIQFHQKFKKLSVSAQELIALLRLEKSADKFIKNFSSGMKQRLKLGLAFYSQTPVILLDEPTSNLDAKNIDWYRQQIQLTNRLVIICSNQPSEYEFCTQLIRLTS